MLSTFTITSVFGILKARTLISQKLSYCNIVSSKYLLCARNYSEHIKQVNSSMRFVQFKLKKNGQQKLGIQLSKNPDNFDDYEIVDITSTCAGMPNNLVDFLKGGNVTMEMAKSILKSAEKVVVPAASAQLLSPVTLPDKVACVGMNYTDHCEEIGAPVPVEPVFFNKFPSTIIGPWDNIIHPTNSESLDFEVELAIIIGKTGKNIPHIEAMDYVFGYCVGHDVSARDWQLEKNGGQWLLGKTMDTFCPLGPAVVTKEAIPDPQNLRLWCKVNDVIKQDSSTSKMVHKVDDVVSFLSRFCTLVPGDVILTGTPPGVGVFRKPPEYLKRGDIVECGIEGIGIIRNKII